MTGELASNLTLKKWFIIKILKIHLFLINLDLNPDSQSLNPAKGNKQPVAAAADGDADADLEARLDALKRL